MLAGCSVLVDPSSLVIKCQTTPGSVSADPCADAAMHCAAGVCQSCAGARELCNGVDDDCDGMIDEGYDQDGDGYTYCGGGVPELADCAPADPTIHPNRTQSVDGTAASVVLDVCDGKDNDCDGIVDEAPDCTQATVTCATTGCTGDLICDMPTGKCIVPRPVGSGCKADTECQGGFCVKPGDFGLGVDLTDNRCATACCTDTDCSADSACAISTSGARVCLPQNVIGRGTTKKSSRCSNSSECVSGACVSGTCRELCSAGTDCGTDACVLSTTSDSAAGSRRYWTCGTTIGRGSGGDLCTPFDPTACKSGWCLDTSKCATPCGKPSDCPSGQSCVLTAVPSFVPLSTPARLGVCVSQSSDSNAATACCTSTDCSGQLCRPKQNGTVWDMVCVPP